MHSKYLLRNSITLACESCTLPDIFNTNFNFFAVYNNVNSNDSIFHLKLFDFIETCLGNDGIYMAAVSLLTYCII